MYYYFLKIFTLVLLKLDVKLQIDFWSVKYRSRQWKGLGGSYILSLSFFGLQESSPRISSPPPLNLHYKNLTSRLQLLPLFSFCYLPLLAESLSFFNTLFQYFSTRFSNLVTSFQRMTHFLTNLAVAILFCFCHTCSFSKFCAF